MRTLFWMFLIFSYSFSEYKWTHYPDVPGVFVTDIAIDCTGNVWVGTADGGISMFNGMKWTNYNTSNSELTNKDIHAIDVDKEGNIWVGTDDGGLNKIYENSWTSYTLSNSNIPSNWVNALKCDNNGIVWGGTDTKGVFKFDGESFQIVKDTSNSDLPTNFIECMSIDSSNNKWIGTGPGLFIFNDATSVLYNASNMEFDRSEINFIYTDNKGNIWFGGGWDYVVNATNEPWRYFHENELGIYKKILTPTGACIDKNNNKWIGLFGQGIVRYNDTDWVNFNEGNSELQCDYIKAITADSLGNIWIGYSQEKGVSYLEIDYDVNINQKSLKHKHSKFNLIDDFVFGNGEIIVKAIDLKGRNFNLFSGKVTDKALLDFSSMSNGVYVINIYSTLSNITTFKKVLFR